MPNEPNGPTQSGGPQAYLPASPDIPLVDVETPAEPEQHRAWSGPSQAVLADPEWTSHSGPEAPIVREEDPEAAQATSEAPPPDHMNDLDELPPAYPSIRQSCSIAGIIILMAFACAPILGLKTWIGGEAAMLIYYGSSGGSARRG